jgi:type IV pilus assembly protein PilQ
MMATNNYKNVAAFTRRLRDCGLALVCIVLLRPALAQENAIQAIDANQQGSNVVVRITMKNPVAKPPIGFSITTPPRIALDFAGTANATGKAVQEIGLGDVRSVNIVQAGERSRVVFNLQRTASYAATVDGNTVVVSIDGSGGVAAASAAQAVSTAPRGAGAPPGRPALKDIDFRRGVDGEGRIVIDLPNRETAIDVRQQGQSIVVDFAAWRCPRYCVDVWMSVISQRRFIPLPQRSRARTCGC